MSARPTCRSCAPCASSGASGEGNRLARVLAAGMRLGPGASPSTDTIFVRKPYFETCAICLEPMLDEVSEDNPFVALDGCQHAFHVKCIAKYMEGKTNPMCPTCRVNPIRENEQDKIKNYETKTESEYGVISVFRYGILVRKEEPASSYMPRTVFYKGDKGSERVVRKEEPNGTKVFYEGDKGSERVVREETASGNKWFYEGVKDKERLVRIRHLNGTEFFYEGDKGSEHIVLFLSNGHKLFYEGDRGYERKVRSEFKDGTKGFYEGARGSERLVRFELTVGTDQFYEGNKGSERLVREETASGTKLFYEGARGSERLVRSELADGTETLLGKRSESETPDDRAKRLRIEALVRSFSIAYPSFT
jgi:hypothetical protein